MNIEEKIKLIYECTIEQDISGEVFFIEEHIKSQQSKIEDLENTIGFLSYNNEKSCLKQHAPKYPFSTNMSKGFDYASPTITPEDIIEVKNISRRSELGGGYGVYILLLTGEFKGYDGYIPFDVFTRVFE